MESMHSPNFVAEWPNLALDAELFGCGGTKFLSEASVLITSAAAGTSTSKGSLSLYLVKPFVSIG
jgi:hypothetical protein